MRFPVLVLLLVGCTAAPVVKAQAPAAPGFDVEPISGLGLFADERVRSQELLAAALAVRDAGVLPLEVTTKAWALAAEGRNPLTGAACGVSLGAWQARKRWGAALGIAGSISGHVWCPDDGGCELDVYGNETSGRAVEAFHLEAPIARKGEALGALAAALTQLAPPVPDPNDSLGIGGSMGGPRPIQDDDRLEVSVSAADRREREAEDQARRHEAFPSLTVAHALACLPAGGTNVGVLIEVSAAGQISRCEAEPSGEPNAAKCVCGQLEKVGGAAWLNGKRWSVELRVDLRDQTSSDRRFVITGSWNTYIERVQRPGEKYPHFNPRVEDPSIEAWRPGHARLATGCFVNAFTQPGSLHSRWGVWFDGAGRPTKAVEQKGFAPLPKDLGGCVARALMTAQSPCPSRAGLWAMADFHVSAKDPNAPAPSPTDILR